MNFTEILVIAIVALIVFGPQRLPEIAKMAGRLFQKIQLFSQTFQAELDKQFKEQNLQDNISKAEKADEVYRKEKEI